MKIYADDIAMLCKDEIEAEEMKNKLDTHLRKFGLIMNREKTEIRKIQEGEEPYKYLGTQVYGTYKETVENFFKKIYHENPARVLKSFHND